MEENPQHNVGRSQPVSESDFVPTPRKLVPTTVITRSADVCQLTMVFSHTSKNRNQNPDRKWS